MIEFETAQWFKEDSTESCRSGCGRKTKGMLMSNRNEPLIRVCGACAKKIIAKAEGDRKKRRGDA